MSSIRRKAIILTLMFVISSHITIISDQDIDELTDYNEQLRESDERSSGIIDVPNWRVGDRWYYSGFLDVRDFVADSGVQTNVQTLSGNLDSIVTDVYVTMVDNVSTLVYKVESDGQYEANNVNLQGYSGDLIIMMDTIEIVRASDLATIDQQATIEVDFDYRILWWDITIDVADLVANYDYRPALEGYDFPLNVGEKWSTHYTRYTNYSGTAMDGVTIPGDSIGSNYTEWEIVSRGNSGVNQAGCSQSYNITTYDSNGDTTGYDWYCPGIGNTVKSSDIQGLGFIANHELLTYFPSSRGHDIEVDVEYPLSPLSMTMDAEVTVTDSSGYPVSGEYVEFRHEIENDLQFGTTNSAGKVTFSFNSGQSPDWSIGGSEHGSHGVIALTNPTTTSTHIGASTVTTDSEVHPVDLVAKSEGVTVERTRENNTVSLNSIIGFAAIPQDILTFSVPVQNRGILSSPATDIKITGPDGVSSTNNVPAMSSLNTERIEIDWSVPHGYPVGYYSVSFIVDENQYITEDGNRSNNVGAFDFFVGRLPTAVITSSTDTVLTSESITIDGATHSIDPDGGYLDCIFEVEQVSGGIQQIPSDDCTLETSWDDDGMFEVSLKVTDDESDTHVDQIIVTVLNRPPVISVVADSYSIPVENSVTFEVTDRWDPDSRGSNTDVDVSWQASCQEGSSVSSRCTVSPMEEGEYAIEVLGIDDDGDIVSEIVAIQVTNVAPYDTEALVWNMGNKLTPDSRGLFSIEEGQELEFQGSAKDSQNDIEELSHLWSPDAEQQPGLTQESIGKYSTITHTYSTSGIHLATLVVTDNDGESADTLTIAIDVINKAPTIDPIAPPLPVAEDDIISITARVSDTPGDLETLTNCFDLDPVTDSDGVGSSTDDCDIEGLMFSGSWPDAESAPSLIIFHTTDDDGESASSEIPIIVNNVKPDAYLMVSNPNPSEGDMISLSANLTTDSIFDIANMEYFWDLDISEDSNGDGIPDNDVDHQGIWLSWTPEKSGRITVQVTAMDESSSDKKTVTIDVTEKPFAFGDIFTPTVIGIIGIILILATAGFVAMRMRSGKDIVNAPLGARKGRKLSIDDAFDNPEFNPFSDKEARASSKTEIETVKETDSDESQVSGETEKMDQLDLEYENTRKETAEIDDVLDELLESEEE